ncbi:vacuolar import and degradation protein-domain-containing protein [Cyathus striatus]|nr:vacuolar import and degradation protein-domain-containing protein [Cyathus striatus]
MPAHQPPSSVHDSAAQDPPQQQVKLCPNCHSALQQLPFLLPLFSPVFCPVCCNHVLPSPTSPAHPQQDSCPLRIDLGLPVSSRLSFPHDPPSTPLSTRRPNPPNLFDSLPHPSFSSPPPEPPHAYPPLSSPHPSKPPQLNIQATHIPPPVLPQQQLSHLPSQSSPSSVSSSRKSNLYPDPLADITGLRVRPRVHHCLYPGASFQGTQKSGRNSYDVNVTIVDVDFASSFLCGYLRIRGLTDDWPELTTYFDAEIIGSRYGFVTQNWGASEQDDMVHWSRFPAFKHIRQEAKNPRMTIDDRDRGAVFMRWKERFLVPDHRVQDINGASFAGFYYVCVDFNPSGPGVSSSRSRSPSHQDIVEDLDVLSTSPTALKSTHERTSSRQAVSTRRRAPSRAPVNPPAATMSGFYYHQHSEPYQQLSLTHVPERFTSSFEFR